jgi:hypothetical protein
MAGGYDEDYCGTYGGDLPFLHQLERIAPRIHLEDIKLLGYLPDAIEDACTTDYSRTGKYRDDYLKLYRRKQLSGDQRAKHPLRFSWERIV